MTNRRWIQNAALLVLLFVVAVTGCSQDSTRTDADPLPSWQEGPAKAAILEFVAAVTDENSKDYVEPAERVATFDNDGTLWSEQPMYFQLFFIFDRINTLAPQHPEWKNEEPFASAIKGDVKSALAGGEHAIIEIAMATHAGNTTEEFSRIVKDWLATAKHPKHAVGVLVISGSNWCLVRISKHLRKELKR